MPNKEYECITFYQVHGDEIDFEDIRFQSQRHRFVHDNSVHKKKVRVNYPYTECPELAISLDLNEEIVAFKFYLKPEIATMYRIKYAQ